MPVKDKIRDPVVSSLSFFRGGSSAGRRWRYALAAIAFLAVALITVDYAYYRNRVYHGVYLEQLNLGGGRLKIFPPSWSGSSGPRRKYPWSCRIPRGR